LARSLVRSLDRPLGFNLRFHFFPRPPSLDFNLVAAPNSSGLNHAAENASAPVCLFLKSRSNCIHQMARFAILGDFQQSFAYAHALPHGHAVELDSARGDVFFALSRDNAEFLDRFGVHQQQLPLTGPSLDTLLESFVFGSESFVEFADRLAVRDRLK